ncbi:MAG: molybdopterin molybdotransferase MoeA [Spirochaetes bacterium]|jgi:molybdopterin molybdotransferase|nr:molybdopterin molybdotransferase MoeA [Spirochaetota bacterium]
MKDKSNKTYFEGALSKILRHAEKTGTEKVSVVESCGRFLSSDIIADINIPLFDNSAMDGYAVKHDDLKNASRDFPVKLIVIDEIKAGDDFSKFKLKAGCAIRIMTGAGIPSGADSVIQVEDTFESEGNVFVSRSVSRHENVRFAGEDIQSGKKVLPMGCRIGSAELGLLVSIGLRNVEVHRRPLVKILSTGDEIADMEDALKPGMIRNSNAYTLMSEVSKYGAVHDYLGIARDNRDEIRNKIIDGLTGDIIITSGGVSMGEYDFVREALVEAGFSIIIENIMMKPGKPLVFGVKKNILFFGLPGNPVSTMISFLEFVRPAILKMMGAFRINKPVMKAVLADPVPKKPGRRHFIRAVFFIKNGALHVTTTGPQGSGILKSMSDANCLIILPEEAGDIEEGSEVDIQLIKHEEI